jgi:hypothetical protein
MPVFGYGRFPMEHFTGQRAVGQYIYVRTKNAICCRTTEQYKRVGPLLVTSSSRSAVPSTVCLSLSALYWANHSRPLSQLVWQPCHTTITMSVWALYQIRLSAGHNDSLQRSPGDGAYKPCAPCWSHLVLAGYGRLLKHKHSCGKHRHLHEACLVELVSCIGKAVSDSSFPCPRGALIDHNLAVHM